MTVLRAAAETHTGYVRSTNQDLALVSGDLVAVADGMGGHLGGEVAARTAIEELLESYLRERTGDGLVTAARRANRAVWRKSRVDRKLHGMGTTLTAAALVMIDDDGDESAVADRAPAGDGGRGAHLILINVGDSRAYVLDRASRAFRQLTEDHSVVEEMVRQGELTPAEAAVHPHRHVLTRALGIEPEVALDIWDLDAVPGSRFLLCSDGLTNEVPDEQIAEILANAADPEQAARELVGRALGHGGMDNVTVVVADVVEGDPDPADTPELVPPRPPRPEAPVMGTPELTGAIPISGPAGSPPPGGEPAPAPAPAPERPAEVEPPPNDSGTNGGSVIAAAPAAATTVAAAAAAGVEVGAGVTDATVAITSATDTAAGATDAATAADTAAGATDTAAGASDAAGAGASDAAGAGPDGRTRRKGRSMRVRQPPTPPAIDGVIDAGGLVRAGPANALGPTGGAHRAHQRRPASAADDQAPYTRPVVLVPQQRETVRDRIVTFRVALFVLLLAGLLAGTAGTVVWFDQSSYFLGLNGNSVAIYEGRPGGMLWFKPQLIETSPVTTSQLLPSTIATLRSGIMESSLTAAEQVAARLKNEKANALAAATTTTTSTSSTTSTSTTTTTTLFAGTVPQSTAPPTTQPQQVTTTTSQPHHVTTTSRPTSQTTVPVTTYPTSTTQPAGTTQRTFGKAFDSIERAASPAGTGRPGGAGR